MNLIECIKKAKERDVSYRRQGSIYLNKSRPGADFLLTEEDILADDWEIVEKEITITAGKLEDAWRAIEKRKFSTIPIGYWSVPSLSELKTELGLK